jgi:peptide/nickel transport system permease protein
LLPADPVLAVVGDHASESTIEAARIRLGLDKPILVQFWIYLTNILQGDLGESVRTGRPIVEELARVFPATLELATLGTLIGVVFGIPLGVWAAVRKDTYIDHLVRFFGLIGYSVPIFWLGLMGLLVFYAKLDWLPGPGRLDFGYEEIVTPVTGLMTVDTLIMGDIELFKNALAHLILPASLLGYFSLAYISRMTRSLMLGQLRQEYILTARVKGVPERRVIWKHAMGNILVPLLTVIALSYGNLLEGSVLTETVFAWRGLGLYITDSIFGQDMPAVLGGTIVVGAIFIIINMLTDVAYRVLDPRAR